jgi:predicted hydrolase (HD superfamily)
MLFGQVLRKTAEKWAENEQKQAKIGVFRDF